MEIEISISASDVKVISIPATTTGDKVLGGRGWFTGWSLRETTGAAVATAHFTSGGNLIGVMNLAAGASDTQWLGDHGVYVTQDVTLTVDSGSIEGAVYVGYIGGP